MGTLNSSSSSLKFWVASVLALLASACTRSSLLSKLNPPQEKIFRYAIEAKLVSLDPHATTDVYSTQAQALFYETLYHYHYLKRPYQVEPLLAESMPLYSKDMKKITIKIKKGIFFHDDPCFAATNGKGREINANDVIYMMERTSAPKFISSFYGGLENNVVGINDYHAGKTTSIAGIKALDSHTVEVNLTKKLPRFIYNFVDQHSSILPKECIEKYGEQIATHPVGTGPFLPQQIELGHRIIATKNPAYRTISYPTEGNPGDKEKGLLEDAGKQLPLLDKVVFDILVEDQPRWLKFISGEFEMSAIPKNNLEKVLQDGHLAPEYAKLGLSHLTQAKSDVTVSIFNMKDPVWGKKKELRQAFALALNVPQIIDVQYGHQAIPAQSIIDPIQYGYDPSFKSRWSERNLAKAKELLAKTGYPDGKGLPPLVTLTDSSTLARILSELEMRQLAEAGIVLKPEPLTWPELTKRLHTGNFTMTGIGYASAIPDVEDSMGIVQSKSIPTHQNPAAYSNPEVDRLADDIEQMENGPARLAKIHKFQELLDEDLPYVPMVHRIGNQLTHYWVKNHVYTDSMFLGGFLKYYKVDPKAKLSP